LVGVGTELQQGCGIRQTNNRKKPASNLVAGFPLPVTVKPVTWGGIELPAQDLYKSSTCSALN
jgi:hypothetical protein